MKVKCPKCGGFDKAPDEYTGKQIRCPACAWEYPAVPWTMPPAAKGKVRQAWTNLILTLLWPCLIVGGIIGFLLAGAKGWISEGTALAPILLILGVGIPVVIFFVIVSLVRWIFRVDEKAEYLRKIAERDIERRP